MTVYFLVHHHGGTIDVSNAEGGGMKVTLRLPVGAPIKEESEASSSRDFVTKVLMNEALWEKLLTEK